MKTRYYISIVMLMLLNIFAASAQTNTLTIPDVTVAAGNTISLPVNLDNTADIVAVQFTLSVPEGITIQPSTAAMTERADGHSITMQLVGENKYMTMIVSSTNKAIKGRTGKLMSVNLTASSALEEESEHQLVLSDVVIGAINGDNLATGFSAGKVAIAKSPDLEVSAVSTTASAVKPGDKFSVSWQVKNIGAVPTAAGWSEQIYLDGENGTSKLLATTYYNSTLNDGGVVSRLAEIGLPQILGVDGNATVRVKLTPDSKAGEPSWLRDNNTASSTTTISVGKMLSLSPEKANVEEASKPNVRFYLQRSGNTTADETFTLAATTDSRITLPESITISKGQSGVYFYAQVNANGVLDDNDVVAMAISGNGYNEAGATLNIEDDTYPSLKLTSPAQDVEEGKIITFTITAQRAPKEDLEIKLSNDFSSRFNTPSIVMPAGQTSVDVTVEAKQDDVPDVEQVVTFTAQAAGYNPASMNIVLVDDDVPTLQLTLTPDAVSEAAGPLAVVAKLRRTDNINKVVTVKFSDDSDGGIYYGRQSVEMAAGVEEVTVNLGPIDNTIVDGERTYNISAAVWIASCSCNASNGTSGGVVTAPLTVYDNDGPALSLASSASVVKEGGKIEITVSRNTETSAGLTVNISSDHDAALQYPATVTIPAGETSVTFTVKSINNDVNDDSFTAIMTVESEGFAKANVWFMVSDQTLPDAQITAIEVSETEIEVGTEITVTATLTNTGSYELPELTKVGFYYSGNSTALATAYLQAPLAVGESVAMSKTITLPNSVGTYNVYAVANDGQAVKELLYTNNTSSTVAVKVVSPYAFTVQTDKDIYQQGDAVNINGKIQGKDVANKAIEVYVINDGYRHVIQLDTDESGAFSTSYQPYAGQIGHFVVGACYPKEGLTESLAAFDVYGIKRTSNSYITCEALMGEVFNGSFGIKNPGVLPITGASVTVASQPENCVVEVACPKSIAAGATTDITFKITPNAVSEGNDWEHIVLNVETNEGAKLETTLYYYCYNTTGKLKASVASIKSTMIKDAARDYPFVITNIGKGETGKITLALPDWMTAVTPIEMSSMSNGDSTTVILRLAPTNDMQLNVPVTGQIGINCANGEGLALPFSIEPVSETTGVLTIDVCDEYTYYTSEAPHVQGAQVKVTHPTTGALLASGTTDEDGKFSVSLNEGYYAVSVSADKHDSYRNNILVDPGTEKNVVVNLSIEAITINWEVEETEIEDEYKIVTTVRYETNVPTPVVEMTVPESIPAKELAEGESLIFNAVLTNKGLITAKDVQVLMPEGFTHLAFEPLSCAELFDLAPQQSVVVPIKVTHIPASASKLGMKRLPDMDNDPCAAQPGTLYFWDCGTDRKWHRYQVALQLGSCRSDDPSTWDNSGNGNYGIPGGGGYYPIPHTGVGGGYFSSSSNNDHISSYEDKGCEPCQNRFLYKMIKCVTSRIPVFETVWDIIGWVSEPAEKIQDKAQDALIERIPKPIYGWVKKFKKWIDIWGDCIEPLYEPCDPGNFNGIRAKYDSKAKRNSYFSYIQEYQDVLSLASDGANAELNRFVEFFGDAQWLDAEDEELGAFLKKFEEFVSSSIDKETLMIYKPQAVSVAQVEHFIDRWNNTVNKIASDNVIDFVKYEEYGRIINAAIEAALSQGYDNVAQMYKAAEEKVMDKLNSASQSVCSSITLQFEQKMVMTRQAFRGTLTVFNGSETTAMTDVKLNLVVTDENGKVATSHEFQINPESLTGFTGNLNFEDGWTLDAQETGVAKVLFIPTKYAAPTVEKLYSFGGTLSYIDPFTGLEVTRTLTPITLTVKPSPNLDLTYFMQRDVIGDDPLTEAVEPCEEAEFSLLINNIGYGDATNVRMITNQPEIVENEKGLLIDFELMSSQLNGGDKTLALGSCVATDFGTIPAKSTSYAQWWIKSSLLGHFTEYDVQATHVTSHDNPDLTLLNDVTIHELIRSLEIGEGDSKMVGFMTNDIVDADDTPDMLYLSNGEIETVAVAASSGIAKTSDADYTLTVNPSKDGWNYGNLTDPTYGVVKLKKIVRQSDGKEISLRNFWQTDRTLRDGKDPLYENRIHFADKFATESAETYILTFEPMPELLLEVASIEGTPAEGTIAYTHVEHVNVMFNKHIDPATFTTDDIALSVQGKKLDTSVIGISTEDNKTFALDLTELNKQAGNGYYVLTIQTAEVTDAEGFFGKAGKSVGWNMYKDGLILVNTSVNPINAGTISGNRNALYGENVTLKAEANKGYEFSNWTVNGDESGKEAVWSAVATSDMDVIANFIKKSYAVTIESENEGGAILGSYTGIYPFGQKLTLSVATNDGYLFKGWIVNDELISKGASLTVTVDSVMSISAKFVNNKKYNQVVELSKGWNWVSGYLKESLPVEPLLESVNRIVGQFDETIKDPELGFIGGIENLELGKSYKIEATSDYSATFTNYIYDLEESPIVMKRGWNWVAYPYYESCNINAVVTNAEEGDYIASQYGFTSYANGYWEGSINQFHAGQGYLYKSASDKTIALDFDAVTPKAMVLSKERAEMGTGNGMDAHKYPNTMNITARLYQGGYELTDGEYNIYALSGSELRGIGQFVNGNYYITVYGDIPTEISFVIENSNTAESYMANEKLMFTNDIVGCRKAPFAITIGDANGINSLMTDGQNITIFSVEGLLINRNAKMKDIKKLHRGVYIVNGKKCIVK